METFNSEEFDMKARQSVPSTTNTSFPAYVKHMTSTVTGSDNNSPRGTVTSKFGSSIITQNISKRNRYTNSVQKGSTIVDGPPSPKRPGQSLIQSPLPFNFKYKSPYIPPSPRATLFGQLGSTTKRSIDSTYSPRQTC